MHMAAAAHPSTVSQMVPAPPAHANRFEEAADEVINPIVLGALTPRITDLNVEYFGFMWPNNAGAGLRYGATLDALGAALMTPSMPAISGGSIAGVAVAAASVAESAAMSGMQAAVGMVGSGVSAVAGPAAALPASAMSAVSSSGSSTVSAPANSVAGATVGRGDPDRAADSGADDGPVAGVDGDVCAVAECEPDDPAAGSAFAGPGAADDAAAPDAGHARLARDHQLHPARPAVLPTPATIGWAKRSDSNPACSTPPRCADPSRRCRWSPAGPAPGLATGHSIAGLRPTRHPRDPIPPMPPQQPPLPNNGDIAHMLNPPPQPQQQPPPPHHPQQHPQQQPQPQQQQPPQPQQPPNNDPSQPAYQPGSGSGTGSGGFGGPGTGGGSSPAGTA